MNLHHLVFIAFVMGGVAAVATLCVLENYSRLRWRTLDEVNGLMRKPDQYFLEDWSVPTELVSASRLMSRLMDVGDRRQKRVLLDNLEEQLGCCYHNSLKIRDWGRTDLHDMVLFRCEGYDENAQRCIRRLFDVSSESCKRLRPALLRIRVWGLIYSLRLDHLAPLPEPAQLLVLCGRDVLDPYKRLKEAVGAMSSVYSGDKWCDEIVAGM